MDENNNLTRFKKAIEDMEFLNKEYEGKNKGTIFRRRYTTIWKRINDYANKMIEETKGNVIKYKISFKMLDGSQLEGNRIIWLPDTLGKETLEFLVRARFKGRVEIVHISKMTTIPLGILITPGTENF